MADDEATRLENEEKQDEVEAHMRGKLANEEPAAEGEDDDFEAHRKGNV